MNYIDMCDACLKIVVVYSEGAGFGINSDGFFELEKLPRYVDSVCRCRLYVHVKNHC